MNKRIDEIRDRCNAATEDIPYLLGEIEKLERENALIKDMYAAVSKDKVESDAQLAASQRREQAAVADMGDYIRMPSSCEICNKAWPNGGLCDKTAEGCIDHGGFDWSGPQEKGDTYD